MSRVYFRQQPVLYVASSLAVCFFIFNAASFATEPTTKITPIPLERGHAFFQEKTRGPNDSILLIVSSLSPQPGPFAFRIVARPADFFASTPKKAVDQKTESAPARPNDLQRPVFDAEPLGTPIRERSFHLLVRDGDPRVAGNYDRAKGILRAYDRRVEVYVDEHDLDRVSAETLRDLVETFTGKIVPRARQTIGEARDIDGDGRFLIFLTCKLARVVGGRYSIDGLVRGADFRLDLPAPFGNRADMLSLNANLTAGPHLRTILAHEYAHAVLTTSRNSNRSRSVPQDEESWLDEAIAHVFERLNDFSTDNIDYRVSAFLSQPEEYRLVVKDYLAADLFRSHGCRGSAFLFLQSLLDRHGNGLLRRLVESDRQGINCVESATGQSFAALFRDWTIDLALGGIEPQKSLDSLKASATPDLRDRFGNLSLAGPRFTRVKVGEPKCSMALVGSSARFLEIDASEVSGFELEVEGSPDAELQVTAIRLKEPLPRLGLSIDIMNDSLSTSRFQARLSQAPGVPLRFERLSWEPLVPRHDSRGTLIPRKELEGDALRQAFSKEGVISADRSASGSIAVDRAEFEDGPLVFKLIGIDEHGRRSAAWAVANPPKTAVLRTKKNDLGKKPSR